jgi:hypothetical protein
MTTPAAEADAIDATLNFLVKGREKPRVMMSAKHAEANRRTGEFRDCRLAISDARGLTPPPALDREGFELAPFPTATTDFYDDGAVERDYYPEVEAFLKRQTGAAEVFIFDHTVRVQDDRKRQEKAKRLPVTVVHNDYTEKSAPQRLKDLLEPAMAARFLGRRFAMVNVWRSIGATAERMPLAVADARTMAAGDYVATDLVYEDRTGEIYQVANGAGQCWHYFSGMRRDEVVLLKCFDSALDGRARWTAHGAFDNPKAPAGTPARESIEVRTVLSFRE